MLTWLFQTQKRSAKQLTRGQGRLGFRGRGVKTEIRGRGAGGRGRGGRGAIQEEGLTSLNRQRMQAVNSLIKAKNTLAQIKAKQKLGRGLTVNQKRGLQVNQLLKVL